MHLVVGVLKEIAAEPSEKYVDFLDDTLDCLRRLCSNAMAKQPACKKDWTTLVQSGLAHITHFSKSSSYSGENEELVTILAMTVFLTSSSREVACAPNLRQHCINTFKHALQQDGTLVQTKTIRCLQSVFSIPDTAVANPYIQALSPKLVELIGQFTAELSSPVPFPANKMAAIQELTEALKVLVDAATNEKKLLIVGLYIPALVNILVEPENFENVSPSRQTAHACALQQLLKIGPQYPQEFRTVVSRNGRLKTRLESCIRSARANKEPSADSQTSAKATSSPTIKLKTDFSNFAR